MPSVTTAWSSRNLRIISLSSHGSSSFSTVAAAPVACVAMDLAHLERAEADLVTVEEALQALDLRDLPRAAVLIQRALGAEFAADATR